MFDLLSDRLSQHLEQIVRERNPFFSSQGHFYVREYLRQELGNWGKVESHFFHFQGKNYENLILDLPNNSQKPPILIGAHYDTVPGSPGADDNATGLAVLLELARFFGENQANYPIRLIAFEDGSYSPAFDLKCGRASRDSLVCYKCRSCVLLLLHSLRFHTTL